VIVPWTQEWSEPVRTLLRTCLGPKTLQLDEALWRWQYEQNPCANGAVPVALFADAPEALGVLGRIPVQLSTPSGEVDAAWGIDVFVLPEFHNAGIGGLLIEDWDAATPVSLSLGVTDMAFAVFLASGRTHVGDVPVFKRMIGWDKVVEPKLGTGLTALIAEKLCAAWGSRALDASAHAPGLEWQTVETIGPEFDALWLSAARGLGLAVRRDRAWVDWRFRRYPRDAFDVFAVRRGGSLVAWVATALAQHGERLIGYVADAVWSSDRTALAFALAMATYELEARGADVVECLASHPALGRELRRLGYWKRPTKTRLLYKINRPEAAPALAGAERLERWHVTFADSDALTVMLHEGS
jgi:GNAT superfamily N-acetyltransferase